MTFYSAASLLASSLCLIVSGISFYTRKTKSHLALGFTTLFVGVWSLFPFFTTVIDDPNLRLTVARILYTFAGLAPFSFLYLTLSILETPLTKFESRFLFITKILGGGFALLSLYSIYIKAIGVYGNCHFVVPGPLYPLFIAYFLVVCTWTFARMLREYPTTSGLKRNQLLYFFGGFAVAYIGGGIHFLASYTSREYFPHDILVATFTVIIGYAILRYRLMDFTLLMRWGLAYFILVALLALVIFPILIASEWASKKYFHWPVGILTLSATGCVILIYDPLRKRITWFVDQIVFKSPDFQVILGGIEDSLNFNYGLLKLSQSLTERLKTIYGADHAGLAVWDFRTTSFKFLPSESFNNQIITRLNEQIGRADFLVRTLESERRLFRNGIILEEELTAFGNRAFPGERITFWKMRRTMRWLGASICIPLMSEHELTGFMILGQKKSQSPYNNEDKKFLSHVAEKVTLALKNVITNPTNEVYVHESQPQPS